ncbi:MAG: hypothetical protein SGARI_000946, partial [Bacillariaceae sp.]
MEDLPPGWEAKLDHGSGKTYYVDHVNHISTWQKPSFPLPPTWTEEDQEVNSFAEDDDLISMMKSVKVTPDPEEKDPFSDVFSTITMDASARAARKVNFGMGSIPDLAAVTEHSVSFEDSGSTHTTKTTGNNCVSASSADVCFSGSSPEFSAIPSASMRSTRTFSERSEYPDSTNQHPASNDLKNWVLSEAAKQRGLAPKGISAIRKAMEKRNMDRALAPENTCARNVTINGYYLTVAQARWWAIQYDIRLRSDTHYWYDPLSGFMGKLGGPIKFIASAEIDAPGEFFVRSSLGETTCTINDREIDDQEMKTWAGVDIQLRPNTKYIVEPDGTTSRAGDDQPLYNWHDKILAAAQKKSRVAKQKVGMDSGLVSMIGKGVVKGLAKGAATMAVGAMMGG